MRFSNIFKVLMCSSLLVLSGIAFAGKGASSSKSMSRGFSPNRNMPSMSSARPTSSSFGSFNKQSSVKTNAGGAFNRDLSNRQAQVNAMRNWDNGHRPNSTQTASGIPLPSSSSGNTRYEQRSAANIPNGVNLPSVSAPPVARSNGPSMSGIMTGMVLGHVLTQPRTVYADGSNNGQGNASARLEPITPEGEFKQSQIPVESAQELGGTQANVAVPQVSTLEPRKNEMKVSEEAEKSTGVLGWLLMAGVIGAVVWYARKRMRVAMQAANNVNTKPHYSL